jgi:hypothetical protein
MFTETNTNAEAGLCQLVKIVQDPETPARVRLEALFKYREIAGFDAIPKATKKVNDSEVYTLNQTRFKLENGFALEPGEFARFLSTVPQAEEQAWYKLYFRTVLLGFITDKAFPAKQRLKSLILLYKLAGIDLDEED